MARCGCTSGGSAGGGCGCTITAGEGITVTQVGDDYIISADADSPGADEITDCTDVRACLSAGPGITYDPATGVIALASETAVYAPQLFAGTDAVNLGSGNAWGRYTKIGDLVQFSAQIDVGTDATFNNDDPLGITLPYNAVANAPGPEQLVTVQAFNQNTGATVNFMAGVGLIPESGGSSVYRLQLNDGAAGGDLDNATRTTPMDWRGWSIRVSGSYEAEPAP